MREPKAALARIDNALTMAAIEYGRLNDYLDQQRERSVTGDMWKLRRADTTRLLNKINQLHAQAVKLADDYLARRAR
jgi:anaerobic ribonucleoside-triphosphate reductase